MTLTRCPDRILLGGGFFQRNIYKTGYLWDAICLERLSNVSHGAGYMAQSDISLSDISLDSFPTRTISLLT